MDDTFVPPSIFTALKLSKGVYKRIVLKRTVFKLFFPLKSVSVNSVLSSYHKLKCMKINEMKLKGLKNRSEYLLSHTCFLLEELLHVCTLFTAINYICILILAMNVYFKTKKQVYFFRTQNSSKAEFY